MKTRRVSQKVRERVLDRIRGALATAVAIGVCLAASSAFAAIFSVNSTAEYCRAGTLPEAMSCAACMQAIPCPIMHACPKRSDARAGSGMMPWLPVSLPPRASSEDERLGTGSAAPRWQLGEVYGPFQFAGDSAWRLVQVLELEPARASLLPQAELLAELPESVDPCGENGEFHTFVHTGPMFREAIPITVGETVERGGFYFTDLLPA